MKQFILEFSNDFTFSDEEYRVQVGNTDFFIDLLFYNRALSCLVPIELKIGKFNPEYIGQINFYPEALDRDVKKAKRKPKCRRYSLRQQGRCSCGIRFKPQYVSDACC